MNATSYMHIYSQHVIDAHNVKPSLTGAVCANIETIKKIAELRDRGYGCKRIADTLCVEEGVGISYKAVERRLKKYSYLSSGSGLRATNSTIRHVASKNISAFEPVISGDLDVNNTNMYRRLDKTEKAIINAILSDPINEIWSVAEVCSILKELSYDYSRQAIYKAMRRLDKRGIPGWIRGKGRFRFCGY